MRTINRRQDSVDKGSKQSFEGSFGLLLVKKQFNDSNADEADLRYGCVNDRFTNEP
jgi:hypothetical protein